MYVSVQPITSGYFPTESIILGEKSFACHTCTVQKNNMIYFLAKIGHQHSINMISRENKTPEKCILSQTFGIRKKVYKILLYCAYLVPRLCLSIHLSLENVSSTIFNLIYRKLPSNSVELFVGTCRIIGSSSFTIPTGTRKPIVKRDGWLNEVPHNLTKLSGWGGHGKQITMDIWMWLVFYPVSLIFLSEAAWRGSKWRLHDCKILQLS